MLVGGSGAAGLFGHAGVMQNAKHTAGVSIPVTALRRP
jgi:hypothetical protein